MTENKSPRALVTGFTGYIGGQLSEALVEQGWDVHALVRGTPRVNRYSLPVTEHQIDESYGSIAKAVATVRADVTFHLASSVIIDHKAEQIEEIITSNILFPTYLVQAMTDCGLTRLINSGTSWEHFDATDRYEPTNFYAATKKAFEDLCAYYVSAKQLNVINLKLFDVYGPNDSRSKIIPLLLRLSESDQSLGMSPGKQSLDMIFITDVVKAYIVAASMALGVHQGVASYAVRTGKTLTLQEIVAIFEGQLGRKLNVIWGGRPYREREVHKPWVSMATLPNWVAEVTIEKGLHKVISDYQAHVKLPCRVEIEPHDPQIR